MKNDVLFGIFQKSPSSTTLSHPPTFQNKPTTRTASLSPFRNRKRNTIFCCFLLLFLSFFFSYLGLSLEILTHPATMKEAFGFRGQTIYLLRAQGFKNRQTA
jgi:hypothetical protein